MVAARPWTRRSHKIITCEETICADVLNSSLSQREAPTTQGLAITDIRLAIIPSSHHIPGQMDPLPLVQGGHRIHRLRTISTLLLHTVHTVFSDGFLSRWFSLLVNFAKVVAPSAFSFPLISSCPTQHFHRHTPHLAVYFSYYVLYQKLGATLRSVTSVGLALA
jgi:hypothetical protein